MSDAHPEVPSAARNALEIEKLRLEIAALKMPVPGFWRRLFDQWQGTVITLILGAFAAFPNFIVDKVKAGFDRVEQRSAQFDKLSGDLSAYVFAAEHMAEYYAGERTVATSPPDLEKEYTTAIATLRRHEHAYRAMLARLWGAAANQRYNVVVEEVKQVDALIHELDTALRQTAKAGPPTSVAPVLDRLKPAIKKLSGDLPEFLATLE